MSIGVIYGFFLVQAAETIKGLLCYENFFGQGNFEKIFGLLIGQVNQ